LAIWAMRGGIVAENSTVCRSFGQAATANVGSYAVTAAGAVPLGSNTVSYSNTGVLSVGAKSLTLSATKTYNGSTSLTGAVTIGGLIDNQTLSYTNATANNANVATANKYINAITLTDGTNGGLASNYALPTLNNANAPVTINPKAMSLSGSKTYDATTSFAASTFGTTGTVSTGVSNETLVVTGAGSVTSANVSAGTQTLTLGTLSLTNGTGIASNYTLTGGTPTGVVNAKTVALTATKTYDASTSLMGAVTVSGLIGAETLNYSGSTASDANVATANKYINAITLTDGTNGGLASNYALPTLNNANAPVTINAKAMSLSGSKTYDATTSFAASTF
jgi:hypothetical protein